MSKRLNIYLTVLVDDKTVGETLAEAVFEFLGADPENLFPQIEEVENFDYAEEEME